MAENAESSEKVGRDNDGAGAGGGGGGEGEEVKEAEPKYSYPLIKYCEMNEDMKQECSELCTTAVEKFPTNLEAAAKYIKSNMDEKYGPSWQAVVGEEFGLQVTYEQQNMLYIFVGGTTAVGVWKCP